MIREEVNNKLKAISADNKKAAKIYAECRDRELTEEMDEAWRARRFQTTFHTPPRTRRKRSHS